MLGSMENVTTNTTPFSLQASGNQRKDTRGTKQQRQNAAKDTRSRGGSLEEGEALPLLRLLHRICDTERGDKIQVGDHEGKGHSQEKRRRKRR